MGTVKLKFQITISE